MTVINFYQTADDGSNFYRMKLPAETLKAQGLDVELLETGADGRDADVLVFNRPSNMRFVDTIEELTAAGYATIVDMDDNFNAVRPGHAMYGAKAKAVHDFAEAACNSATAVIGTTQAVIDQYGFGHGFVIPNYVPEYYFDLAHPDRDEVWVGWSGTVSSHPNDLQTTQGQVEKALSGTNARFAYVGPKEQSHLVRNALKLKSNPLVTGWMPLKLYPEAISRLDIGIVPLEPCRFNDSKSWLKMLEFAATGVVPIGSPTVPNKQLAKAGVGQIATNNWSTRISNLLKSPSLLTQKKAEYREAARAFTMERNIYRWADVIEFAVSHRLARV